MRGKILNTIKLSRILPAALICCLQLAATAAEPSVVIQVPSMLISRDIADKVHKIISTGHYSQLESMADELRSKKLCFENGVWQLDVFYHAFNDTGITSDAEWERYLATLKEWTKKEPRSATARVALGEAYIGYAWRARGAGYANTVSPTQFNSFAERLKLAQDALMEARDLKPLCPGWFTAITSVALGENWEKSAEYKLCEESMDKEPAHTSILWYIAAYNLQTKWGGEQGEWQRFASMWADKIGGEDGDITYTRIIWNVDSANPSPRPLPSGISWPRLKNGFECLMKKYPDSLQVASRYAKFAARAGDFATAQSLFENRIHNDADLTTWRTLALFEEYKIYAYSLPTDRPRMVAMPK